MIWLIRLKWYIVIAIHCKAFYNVALKQDLSYFSQNYFCRFYYNYVHTVLISRNEKWFRFYFCSRLNYQLLTNQEMNFFLMRCFICQRHRIAFWMFSIISFTNWNIFYKKSMWYIDRLRWLYRHIYPILKENDRFILNACFQRNHFGCNRIYLPEIIFELFSIWYIERGYLKIFFACFKLFFSCLK